MPEKEKTTPQVARAIADTAQRRIDGMVEDIAARLRRVAEEVERYGARGEYGRIVHEITYSLAHHDLGGLLAQVAERNKWEARATAPDHIDYPKEDEHGSTVA